MTVAAQQQTHPDVDEVLLSSTQLAERVAKVAREIAADYADRQPLVVGTLKGAVVFMSDLVREMDPVPEGLQMEFVRASSYGAGTASSGKVVLGATTLSEADVAGRHVLVVEDIVDTGRTAARLVEHFASCGAASVKLVSLLSKPARREVAFEPDYLCFEVPDRFVVGYGLDFDERYRSLPYIGVLRPECYGGH